MEAPPLDFTTKMLGKINLAPMVRMNTLPFRLLTKAYGADYVFSEEIIDRKFLTCVRIENELLQTIDYVTARDYGLVLRLKKEERDHFILQIGTNNAETAVQAVRKLLPEIGGVDVNMGCPKKFSVQGGMGSAMMRDVENSKNIMKALVDNFGKQISVSCKIRVLKTFEDTLKYVLAMQEAGVHWISIHPRTSAEESRVPARWFTVKRLIDTGLIKIPVLGSGDLFSPLDVHKYLSFTGANGVIIARGAIHNPQIFKLKERLLNSQVPLIQSSTTENEDDWKDNTVEPLQQSEQQSESPCKEEETKNNKKGKTEYEEESIEFSQNLVKVYERRYARFPMETDILEQVKEYFTLCVQTGNHYQNTKYCIMYMLKTHKHHFDLFKKIHSSKTLSDYARALDLESHFDSLPPAYFQHFEGNFYRKNKHIVDVEAAKVGLLVEKQHGFKIDGQRIDTQGVVGQKREATPLEQQKGIEEDGAMEENAQTTKRIKI